MDVNEIDSGQNGNSLKTCSDCMSAHETFETYTYRRMHCFRCNHCSMEDIDLEDYSQNYDLVTYIDNGFQSVENEDMKELGSFKWFCQNCLDNMAIPKIPAIENDKPSWFHELTSYFDNKFQELDIKVNKNIEGLAVDMSAFKQNVDTQLKTLKEVTPTFPALSNVSNLSTGTPPRKRKNAQPGPVLSPQSLPISAIPIAADSYKAVLKLDSTDATCNASVLKEMCVEKMKAGNIVPDFQSKASSNGSINLLFKSFKDALDLKAIFEDKMKKLDVKNPVRKNVKRIDLVGLPYEVTKEEALQALVKDNPGLGLSVCSDDPSTAVMSTNSDMFLSVIDVKKCRESPIYRVLINATECLVNLMDGVPIKLMSSVLHKYILPDSIQCFKCYRFNHYADKCKFSPVCGKCSSTSHKTSECPSTASKCINCVRNNHKDDAHPAYSQKCPFFT